MQYTFRVSETQLNDILDEYLPQFEAIYSHNWLLMNKSFVVFVPKGYNPQTDELTLRIYTDYQPLLNRFLKDNELVEHYEEKDGEKLYELPFSDESEDTVFNNSYWKPVFGGYRKIPVVQ